jgi:hypothetical protein
MVSIEVIALVLTGLSITASIIYYATIIRNQDKTRRTEILFQRLQRDASQFEAWGEVVFVQEWKSVEELNEKYPWETEPEARGKWLYVVSLYNNIGLLLQENVIDSKLIFRVFTAGAILTTWKKYEPVIFEIRNNSGENNWSGFEYLAEEARRLFPEVSLIESAKL